MLSICLVGLFFRTRCSSLVAAAAAAICCSPSFVCCRDLSKACLRLLFFIVVPRLLYVVIICPEFVVVCHPSFIVRRRRQVISPVNNPTVPWLTGPLCSVVGVGICMIVCRDWLVHCVQWLVLVSVWSCHVTDWSTVFSGWCWYLYDRVMWLTGPLCSVVGVGICMIVSCDYWRRGSTWWRPAQRWHWLRRWSSQVILPWTEGASLPDISLPSVCRLLSEIQRQRFVYTMWCRCELCDCLPITHCFLSMITE